jgi:pimeloyl-ACP methyl ester carboxylesterase
MPTAGTWTQEEAQAQSLGGNLATINSATDNQFILNNMFQDFSSVGGPNAATQNQLWMGYYDPTGAQNNDGGGALHASSFVWANGQQSTYTNWDATNGEPNNQGGVEYYGAIYGPARGSAIGAWNDFPNAESFYGIAELAKPALQTVATSPYTPPTSLVTPNSSFMEVFKHGSFQTGVALDPTKATVVLTPGFNDTPSSWAKQVAAAYGSNLSNLNVVAWNWSADAGNLSQPWTLGQATSRAPNEGTALGQTLTSSLGANYNLPIHFIGHSLGTLVNAEAAQVFDGNTHDNTNTQLTLFDDAEVANLFALGQASTWAAPLPSTSVGRIDNYVTAFGDLHPNAQAVNVLLTQSTDNGFPTSQDLHAYHNYPPQYYVNTEQLAGGGSGGYDWAIENPGSSSSFPAGSYYVQSTNPLTPMVLSQVSQTDATADLLIQRAKELPVAIPVAGYFLGGNLINGSIQILGQVQDFLTQESGSQVVGAPFALSLQLGGQATNNEQAQKLSIKQVSNASESSSPSQAWIPIEIPANAQDLSFNFSMTGVDPADYLAAGINNTQLFAIEGAYIPDSTLESSGLLDVSAWAGQDVDLFVGDSGIASNGTMDVQDIQFYEVPEPSIMVSLVSCMLFVFWRRPSRQTFDLCHRIA